MAAPLSALSTTDDLVACLEGLGGPYVAYSAELRTNAVDGAVVAEYAKAGNLDELFDGLSITNKLHRSKLRNVFGAMTSPAAKPVIDVFFKGGESPEEKLTKLRNTLADWRKEQPHRMEPYFHYTSRHVAGLILNGGFKPGDVGMAGKGVYLTEQSPAEPVDERARREREADLRAHHDRAAEVLVAHARVAEDLAREEDDRVDAAELLEEHDAQHDRQRPALARRAAAGRGRAGDGAAGARGVGGRRGARGAAEEAEVAARDRARGGGVGGLVRRAGGAGRALRGGG